MEWIQERTWTVAMTNKDLDRLLELQFDSYSGLEDDEEIEYQCLKLKIEFQLEQHQICLNSIDGSKIIRKYGQLKKSKNDES